VERLSDVEREVLWDRWEAGESQRSISRRLGRSPTTVRTQLVASGWRRANPGGEWCSARLSSVEPEEISRGIAGGESFRSIASRLGRSPSTVSREVNTKPSTGRCLFRAEALYVENCGGLCAPGGLCAGLRADRNQPRPRYGTWS